ncbi:MAG TPA: hypothetical protein VEX68_12455 [Bryobacteraceae bacterium]|nr:hypothetical protein [Bryobacteraceae bacterium]
MKINAYITSTVADGKFVDIPVAFNVAFDSNPLATIRIRVA